MSRINNHIKIRLLIGIVLSLCMGKSYACAYHEDGFNFGVFGQHMPASQFHPLAARKLPSLELTHPDTIRVPSDKQKSLRLRYYQPSLYKDIQVTFTPTEDIELANKNSVPLEKLFGAFDLVFQAKQQGRHEIQIAINGMQNGKPYSALQKLVIYAE